MKETMLIANTHVNRNGFDVIERIEEIFMNDDGTAKVLVKDSFIEGLVVARDEFFATIPVIQF